MYILFEKTWFFVDSFKISGQEFFVDENGNVLASTRAMSASKNGLKNAREFNFNLRARLN